MKSLIVVLGLLLLASTIEAQERDDLFRERIEQMCIAQWAGPYPTLSRAAQSWIREDSLRACISSLAADPLVESKMTRFQERWNGFLTCRWWDTCDYRSQGVRGSSCVQEAREYERAANAWIHSSDMTGFADYIQARERFNACERQGR